VGWRRPERSRRARERLGRALGASGRISTPSIISERLAASHGRWLAASARPSAPPASAPAHSPQVTAHQTRAEVAAIRRALLSMRLLYSRSTLDIDGACVYCTAHGRSNCVRSGQKCVVIHAQMPVRFGRTTTAIPRETSEERGDESGRVVGDNREFPGRGGVATTCDVHGVGRSSVMLSNAGVMPVSTCLVTTSGASSQPRSRWSTWRNTRRRG